MLGSLKYWEIVTARLHPKHSSTLAGDTMKVLAPGAEMNISQNGNDSDWKNVNGSIL